MRNRAELLALVLLLTSLPAAALKSDRDKPMDIRADASSAFTGEGKATLTGNVVITQGTLEVRADRADISQSESGEVSRAVLTGAPATLAEDLDDGGRLDARAAKIDYDMAGKLVVLTGDAVVAQPQGELRGERITYNLETGRLDAGGPEGGNRVFLRMNPQPKKPAAPAADKPAD
ncbi:MAG: lipopolysaccharide transport periplasmic protein LptA [Xanthomonadaceae bacterium]|jgi:lipopolysaccharide export system protein LptA|nr:lipopolysaccharide transport periplasmic protein LptA [Xanthomonadaceae bacterium]